MLAGPANEQSPTHTARGDEDAGLRLWRREVERLRRLGALPSLRARRPAEGEVAPRERPATGQRSALVSVSHSQGRERGPHGDCEAAVGARRGPGSIALYLRFVGQVAACRPRARASPNRITAPVRDAKAV